MNIQLPAGLTSKQLPGLVLALALAACASQPTIPFEQPPALAGQPVVEIPTVSVLTTSPAMDRFAQSYLEKHSDPARRLDALLRAVNPAGSLEFDYHGDLTLTAEEAFQELRGNCLAFSNMFIALARKAGLKARYQEVVLPAEWSNQQDMFVLSKHINILASNGKQEYSLDLLQRTYRPGATSYPISDAIAAAQYFNNLGVEALLEKNLALARANFIAALREHAGLAYVWSNLGVVYSRNQQAKHASWAYQKALSVDDGEEVALNNLMLIYLQQENTTAANQIEKRLERHRRSNPYYLAVLANRAAVEQRHRDAVKLLRRAIQKKSDEHRFHFAMAKNWYQLGETEKAAASFELAKQLAPLMVANETYNKSLQELVNTGHTQSPAHIQGG